MRTVTYQVPEPDRARAAIAEFVALDDQAIATRGRDASVAVRTRLSKRQMRWLENGRRAGCEPEAVLRALVDLGVELGLDWDAIAKPSELREAIRTSVRVRRA